MAQVTVEAKLIRRKDGKAEIELVNKGDATAISLKLNVRNPETMKRVLPAYVSDGYFNLLPGERRKVSLVYGAQEGKVCVSVEGYNVPRKNLVTF